MNAARRSLVDVSQLPEKGEVVIDAENHVAGRLATYIAKALLERPELWIVVVNTEKLVITGDEEMVIEWIKRKIGEWRTHYNPERVGPKIPRRPDRIFKRIVRGMLPKKTETGRRALKRLRVYMSMPMEFFQRKRLVLYEVPEAKLRLRPLLRYVTLEGVWRNVDPAAWEQWKKARDMWEKKIKQQASG